MLLFLKDGLSKRDLAFWRDCLVLVGLFVDTHPIRGMLPSGRGFPGDPFSGFSIWERQFTLLEHPGYRPIYGRSFWLFWKVPAYFVGKKNGNTTSWGMKVLGDRVSLGSKTILKWFQALFTKPLFLEGTFSRDGYGVPPVNGFSRGLLGAFFSIYCVYCSVYSRGQPFWGNRPSSIGVKRSGLAVISAWRFTRFI